jgi:hypothetical protein
MGAAALLGPIAEAAGGDSGAVFIAAAGLAVAAAVLALALPLDGRRERLPA